MSTYPHCWFDQIVAVAAAAAAGAIVKVHRVRVDATQPHTAQKGSFIGNHKKKMVKSIPQKEIFQGDCFEKVQKKH